MAHEDLQIMNTALDSGNWVKLRGAIFTPGYNKSNEAKPINGVANSTIPEGDRVGIQPTSITVRGVINVDDFDSDTDFHSVTPSTVTSTTETGESNTGKMTMGYLKSLWRNTAGQTKLKLLLGDPSRTQKTWKNWDDTSSEIYIVVDSINPVPAAGTQGNHFINFTITGREVQPDGTFTT